MRKFTKLIVVLGALGVFAACTGTGGAQEADNSAEATTTVAKMTGESMAELVLRFDSDAEIRDNVIGFKLQEREIVIVYDEENDRMRTLTPVAPAELLTEELLMRMAQANYDSVLDARYAVADGLVWAAYIHPLASLEEDQLLSAIAQVVTAAETFGTTYTSGAMVFGGGDSSAIHDELLKSLEDAAKKKDDI